MIEVLLVDNHTEEDDALDNVQKRLRAGGYSPTLETVNGEICDLDIIHRHSPELVFIDIALTDEEEAELNSALCTHVLDRSAAEFSGMKTLRRIRAGYPDLPVLLMSRLPLRQ